MNATRFDALARSVGEKRTRRGLFSGMALIATALWALHRGAYRVAAQEFWPCPDGVDGHRRDCMCECRRFMGPAVAACQAACVACKGHVSPVCFDVDDRGEPTGTPVCCADRKPCRRICGDCPACEPLPDLM